MSYILKALYLKVKLGRVYEEKLLCTTKLLDLIYSSSLYSEANLFILLLDKLLMNL